MLQLSSVLMPIALRLFLFLTSLQVGVTTAERGESPTLPAFSFGATNVSFVQNFCHIHEKVGSGEIERRDALRGLNLTVGLTDYYTFSDENGEIHIDDDNKIGIAVQVLDYLASSAGFKWRNSYGVVSSTLPADKSWTDLLVRGTKQYDVLGDYWGQMTNRMERGIIFPAGFHDGSFIMVRESEIQDDFNFFAFLAPFDYLLWLILMMITLLTGLIYYIVDLLDSRRLKKEMDRKSLAWSLYSSAISFTDGHCSYDPKSFPTSLVSLSTGFVFLIVISSYTANLTNFLITTKSGGLKISGIEDALHAKLKFCTWRGTATNDYLTSQKANIVPKESQAEVFSSLNSGECDIALVTRDAYHRYERDKEFNGDCKLEWVGRTVRFDKAGLALADSVGTCSSLFRDILDIHMKEMIDKNELENMKNEFLTKVGDIDCEKELEKENDDVELSVTNMGGILILHGSILLCALIASVISFRHHPSRNMASFISRSLFIKKNTSSCFTNQNAIEAHDGKLSVEQDAQLSVEQDAQLSVEDVSEICGEMMRSHDEKFEALNEKLDKIFEFIYSSGE